MRVRVRVRIDLVEALGRVRVRVRVRIDLVGAGNENATTTTLATVTLTWSKKSLLFLMILMHTSSPECRSTHWTALEKAALPRYSRTWWAESRGKLRAVVSGARVSVAIVSVARVSGYHHSEYGYRGTHAPGSARR